MPKNKCMNSKIFYWTSVGSIKEKTLCFKFFTTSNKCFLTSKVDCRGHKRQSLTQVKIPNSLTLKTMNNISCQLAMMTARFSYLISSCLLIWRERGIGKTNQQKLKQSKGPSNINASIQPFASKVSRLSSPGAWSWPREPWNLFRISWMSCKSSSITNSLIVIL